MPLLTRFNYWLEAHMAHYGHGICMVLSNVLTHLGHGHWGVF